MRMPSRDSGVWAFGIIASAITATAANLDLFPWMPEDIKHYLSLASFIIGVTCGKMAHSPQPSKARQKRDAALDHAVRAIGKRR